MIILLLVVVAISAYYLGTRQASNQEKIAVIPTVTPMEIELMPSPTIEQQELPGWRKVVFQKCGVTFLVPPKKEPYYYPPSGATTPVPVGENIGSGRFWDIPRGVIWSTILNFITKDQARISQMAASFASAGDAGGVPASIYVSCMDNDSALTNVTLIDLIKTKIQEYNNSKEPKSGMMPESYKIENTADIKKWGKDVVLIQLVAGSNPTSDDYYVIVTQNKIFEIRKIVQTQDEFVKKTAGDILDKLVFD